MIGYGLAFVIGYVVIGTVRVLRNIEVKPLSPGLIVWGAVFMVLNWVATL